MKDYVDELLSRLEQDYPEIFDELHGWSARRGHGDMKLTIARQNRFIFKHMPRLLARVPEHGVVDRETIGSHYDEEQIPVVVIQQKEIIHWKGKGG